ncbi:MAG: rhodanese-like domain-containing protein, partial [Gammaproteobacteria bacterium]|nr:rhodanese-like domain-containing protein [Gammaproteobacteria bacterium]
MIENLTPQQSWDLMQANPSAVMIDVRTKVEHDFVGHPVNAVHVPWKEAPDWQVNPGFVEQVK